MSEREQGKPCRLSRPGVGERRRREPAQHWQGKGCPIKLNGCL